MSAITVADRVRDFTAAPRRLFIGGQWTDSATGQTFQTLDPATGEPLAVVSQAGAEDVDRAVRAARAAFAEDSPWRTMAPSQRGRIIHRIGDLLGEHADELALLDTLDNGKPVSFAATADLPMSVDLFHYMAGWASKLEGRTIPYSNAPAGKQFALTLREPAGVVGQIIPWNFPVMMAAWKLAPALAAGCTVVFKPAEQTPLSALRLAELMQEAGLPDGVVNILPGYGDAGAALAAHPGVDKIAFTGSTEVGREIVRAAAGNLKRVSLELGGKSPNVVFADADLPAAVANSTWAIFFNSGESCTAGSRLLVERSVFDEVVAAIAEQAKAIKLGPGVDPDTQMGPLISAEHRERVLGFVRSGLDSGAEVACGGAAPEGRGYFVEPTILTGTAPGMPVRDEEIFGPVLVAEPFDTPEEAARLAGHASYGLAAGVFTRDIDKALTFASRVQAGNVWVNTWNTMDAAVPFGGYKQSGWGREMGAEVLDNYLQTKSVIIGLS
jgi:phenylacetaldehyde dehydrogenase